MFDRISGVGYPQGELEIASGRDNDTEHSQSLE
jgi:hypothetical protein